MNLFLFRNNNNLIALVASHSRVARISAVLRGLQTIEQVAGRRAVATRLIIYN